MGRPLWSRRRKYFLLSCVILLWLAACAWLAWSVYKGVRGGTALQMAALQNTLAAQAAQGIEDHLAGLQRTLELLAEDEHVAATNREGERRLQRYYDSLGSELQSITRMGPDGTIVYTWPNAGSIGSSIREQAHVKKLLASHQPVLSDVFLSVQGYRSIALHVPVFRAGTFDGSIAVLVPVDWIAQHYVAGIHVGAAGYAWVIGRDGVEIYGPNKTHIGTSTIGRDGQGPAEEELALAMIQGSSGVTVIPRDHASGAATGMQVAYLPIPLADSFWSIAVAAPENEILSMMTGFLRPWLVALLLLVAGIGALLTLAFRLTAVAERRRAREEAEAHYRALIEGLPVINYVVEPGHPNRTRYISPQVKHMLGFTPAEWTADPDLWRRQIHPDDRARVEEIVGRNDAKGAPTEMEYRVLTADGQVRWIYNRSAFANDGNGVTINGVMMDITERRRAEEALREREEQLTQARRLEAVGRLAGGVAHDFNNLLTVIGGYADLLLAAPDLPGGLRADAREIVTTSRRAQVLTDQLLAYSRKQPHSPQVLDLNVHAAKMEGMLRRLIGEHIALVIAADPDLVRARADPGQLEQVIMNLAVNARDSMKDGGTLTVTTSRAVRGSEPDQERPGLAAGEWAVLSVRDTGAGMEAETLGHIFEPFFTTKEKGRGTGLGLSTVYGIVAQSSGMVFVHSAPGAGATFEIFLPLTTDEIEKPQPAGPRDARPDTSQPRSAGRILLVEDERSVRELTRTILAKAGYTVLEAGNGREALAAHTAMDGQIDLLLTDVIMPGMGGAELARLLRAAHPDLEVVFISGYADDQLGAQGKLGEGIHLLRKPYTPAELLEAIARARMRNGTP